MEEQEAHLYHVIQEVKQFSPTTGARLSSPTIQKYGKKSFEKVILPSLRKQGMSLEIIHDPNNWIAENAEKLARFQQDQAEARAKAKAEEFQRSVDEEVERRLAALESDKSKKAKG